MSSPDDQTWIRDAIRRFEVPLLRYAQGITRDAEIARDVVQDTFLKLCRSQQADLGERLAPWLYTVCRNRAIDVCRKEGRMTTTDELALASHERAIQAIDEGRFDNEIVPIAGVEQDEGPRRGSTLEKLAGLQPLLEGEADQLPAEAQVVGHGAVDVVLADAARAQREPEAKGQRLPAHAFSSSSAATSARVASRLGRESARAERGPRGSSPAPAARTARTTRAKASSAIRPAACKTAADWA